MTDSRYHQILDYLRNLVAGTQWEGRLFAVGGCCRDEVMGTEIKDVDIAVNLPLGSVKFARWLEERHLLAAPPTIFARYATVMLTLREFPDDELELVQTRKGKYVAETFDHPEVLFGSVEEDCLLRDLTINALYHDISADRLIDPTGHGLDDIHHHRLRTPSDPDVTMTDDPLRALRLIRFASRYGWSIDRPTMAAMKAHIDGLKDIKPERIQAEINKILVSPRVDEALRRMRQIGAISLIFPELTKTFRMKEPTDPSRKTSVWDHTVKTVAATPPVLEVRLGALLHDAGKTRVLPVADKEGNPSFVQHEQHSAQLAKKILRRLKYHSPTLREVSFLCANHTVAERWGDHGQNIKPKAISRLLKACISEKRFDHLLSLIHADNISRPNPRTEQVEAIRRLSAEERHLFETEEGAEAAPENEKQSQRRRRRPRGQRRSGARRQRHGQQRKK